MKRSPVYALLVWMLVACAGGGTIASAPVPQTAPAAAPSPTPTTSQPAARSSAGSIDSAPRSIAKSNLSEAPANWQLLDPAADHVPGISVERAKRELLAGKQPKRVVLVAVIDGGVDTAHSALRPNLWANPKEIPSNGIDEDGNGYVDDVRGWNFIGGRNGQDVDHDTFELTRLFARCNGGPTGVPPKPSADKCAKIATEFEKKRTEAVQTLQNVARADSALSRAVSILTPLVKGPLTKETVAALKPEGFQGQQARAVYLQLAMQGITPAAIADARKAYESQVKYGLDTAYNSRSIVGDNYGDPTERRYGNHDVTGPDSKHGTHVAGIIAAVKQGAEGMEGIAASSVRIMAVRAVPDGDERDKDIANAIRYAVDQGASVINMSFGKAYSPFKGAVDDAVKYADAHGVLMVHASGNEGQNNDTDDNFPNAMYLDGGRAQNWIEVGASSWKGGESLVTSFSNWGHTGVDVFAPGEDILSTVTNGGYERDSGTSMAAPVVSGLAALIMAYYPSLTAADVKRIICASATRYDQLVTRPGSQEKVPFASLSVTGGVVSAYNALRMAEQAAVMK